MPPKNPFNPSGLIRCLAFSLGLWAIIGAMAYYHRDIKLEDYNPTVFRLFITLVPLIQLFLGVKACLSLANQPDPPTSGASTPIGLMLTFAFAAVSGVTNHSNPRNLYLELFCVTAPMYILMAWKMYEAMTMRTGRLSA